MEITFIHLGVAPPLCFADANVAVYEQTVAYFLATLWPRLGPITGGDVNL